MTTSSETSHRRSGTHRAGGLKRPVTVFIAVALGGIAITIYARLDDWKRGQR